MNRKICLLVALIFCILCFSSAFAFYSITLPEGLNVYAEPGYYAEVIGAVTQGVFAIVEEQTDACGNVFGKLDHDAGWVAIPSENYSAQLYAGDEIYAGPGYDFEVAFVLAEDGVSNLTHQAWDASGNLWGKLEAVEGWVFIKNIDAMIYKPVSADFASEELIAKGPYEYVIADDSLNATEIAVYANETLTDVCFYLLSFDDYGFSENPLYNLPILEPDKPLIACVAFYGDNTTYGVSFTDEAGVQRCYNISISGMDGSLELTECVEHHADEVK